MSSPGHRARSSAGLVLILAGVIVVAAVAALVLNGALPRSPGTTTPTTGVGAPAWHTFSDLYTMSGMMGGGSTAMMDHSGNMVNVTPSQNYQSDSCSLGPTTATVAGSMRSTSIMTCSYLGASYSGVVPDSCNLGTSVQVNGEMVPGDSCILQHTG